MRNLGLDIVRFFAVLLVVGRHWEKFSADSPRILRLWQIGGWVGVDLFFVISGFLISSLLFKEFQSTGNVNIKRFLIRRGFKIYPSFWILILVSVLLRNIQGQPKSLSSILIELFFIQNYWYGVWLYTWSLAVEEHFYLGTAVLFKGLKQIGINRWIKIIPFVCGFTFLACGLMRYFEISRVSHYFFINHKFKTHLRIDSLCFGVLIGYLACFKNLFPVVHKLRASLLILLGVPLLLPAFLFSVGTHPWILIWGVTLFYIGSGFIVLGALQLKDSNHSILKFFGTLGSASYSIYLWHLPVLVWLIPVFRKLIVLKPDFEFWIYVLSSFGVGWSMYLIVEKPSLRLRDWFDKHLFKERADLRPPLQPTLIYDPFSKTAEKI